MGPVYLERLSTTAGFLQNAPIEFSRKLTCIIGARGTCKSTLIESIRFCLSAYEDRDRMIEGSKQADSNSWLKFIAETLGKGTVRASVAQDGPSGPLNLSVERDFNSESRIYVDDIREHTDQSLLKCFEIYSQGDLQRMADGDKNRLILIDRPNAEQIARFEGERRIIGQRLREVGGDLKTTRAHIQKLRSDLREAPSLEQQLAELRRNRPILSAELEASRTAHLNRRAVVSAVKDALEVQQEAIVHLGATTQFIKPLADVTGRVEALDVEGLSHVVILLQEIGAALLETNVLIARIEDLRLDEAAPRLEKDFEELEAAYYLLQSQQNEINEALKREDRLQHQIEHMNALREELERAHSKERSLLQERAVRRAEIKVLSESIYELRLEQVDAINANHSNLILLSLSPGSQSKAYVELVARLLNGSRIREQPQVAEDLAKRLRPSELTDLVESGDSSSLAALLNRDMGQMTRVVSHLADHERLYDLEAEILEDRLDIYLNHAGVSKPIESLSNGQKATALLPLILGPSAHPLIIDQPEDDLDNSFIYQSLVETIHRLKEERQIIFVTHNANIPVLGEAEQVIVMSMKGAKLANPPQTGTVDERKEDILNLLEGGAEAFKARHRRYDQLLGRA